MYQHVLGIWKNSSTARNISKVSVGDAVSRVLAMGSTLILIRGLTKSDYASYVAFTSLAALSASLVGSGINNALVRFSAEYHSETGKKAYAIYTLSLVIEVTAFLLLLAFVLVAPTRIASFMLGQSGFERALLIGMLFGLGTLLFEVGRSILQAEERFGLYVGFLWLRYGLIFLILMGLWLSKEMAFEITAWALTLCQLALGIGVAFYGILGMQVRHLPQILDEEKSTIHCFVSASGWLIAYFVTLAAFGRMDVIMLSRFRSAVELANYGVAFQYYSLGLLLLGSVSAVLRPKFSRVEMQDTDRQRRFMTSWLRFTVWIGVPVLLFIAFGKPVFVWINGIQYEEAFVILAVLSGGAWLSLMLSPLVNILMSQRRFRTLFLLAVCAFFASFVMTYLGVRIGGGLGAAIAVVLTHNIVLQVPILWMVSR